MAEPTTYMEAQSSDRDLAECIGRAREQLGAVQGTIREAQGIAGRGAGGRELALVQTKLDEARLWLGELRLTEPAN